MQFSESRQYQTTRRLIGGLFLCLLLMPICFFFDLPVAKNVNYLALPGEIRHLLTCSEVFGHLYGIAFILLTTWTVSVANRRNVQLIAGLLLCTSLVVTLVKSSLVRIRPRGGQAAEFDSVWETFGGLNPVLTNLDFSRLGISNLQSYPSGHTASAFVLAICLAIVFPRGRYLFLLFAFLSGAQRIGFAAHYLSDVCGGAIVALVCCTIFVNTRFGKELLLEEPNHPPVLAEFDSEGQERESGDRNAARVA